MSRTRSVRYATAAAGLPAGTPAGHGPGGYIAKDENALVSVTHRCAWRR